MENKFDKKNPRKILGYLMAIAMVFLSPNLFAQCTNTSSYGGTVAPDNFGNPATGISTCNYTSEYSTITAVSAGYSYTNSITYASNPAFTGYVTVRSGTPAGPVVAHGASPLAWTATVSGNHYIHWNDDSLCVSSTGCHVTSMTYTGGAPVTVYGCTDILATNYDSLANFDDGTCIYPCAVGAHSTSFESGLTGTYWKNDASNYLSGTAPYIYGGWQAKTGPTSSTNTGPTAAFDSSTYMYVEASYSGIQDYYLYSNCLDLSTLADPALVFAAHMFGANIGTLSIQAKATSASTWDTLWSSTGDLGNMWNEYVVSLTDTALGTGTVDVRFHYNKTITGYYADAAIDLVRVMEAPVQGCTDALGASNYNPLATIDDGSCLYPGCLDPLATNYCATCNVSVPTSCIFPICNTLDFSDGFESANLGTNGWTTVSGADASASLITGANAVLDTVSLEFSGSANYSNWVGSSTATDDSIAFTNTAHMASATLCMDMSNAAAIVNMSFDAVFAGYYSGYSWLRVKANGVVIADKNGDKFHKKVTNYSAVDELNDDITYDLSAYSGQSSVYITIESANKYGTTYSATYHDIVRIDDVKVFNVYPCTYYAASATGTDASCNAGTDGTASVVVSSPMATNNTYLWSDGQTTAIAIGLSAGTYTCTTTDSINGCTATTASVTIGEPSAVIISAQIFDATGPLNADGSVVLSTSGGSPCPTTVQLGSGTGVTSGKGLFHTGWMDGVSQSTYTSAEILAGGLAVGDDLSSIGWDIVSASAQSLGTVNISIIDSSGASTAVYTGTPTAVVGWNDFAFTSNYTWNGGDIVIEFCHDASAYGTSSTYRYTAMPSSAFLTYRYGDFPASSICATGGYGPYTNTYRANIRLGTTQLPYAFAWSTGDTTATAANLSMGPISCVVTDCAGCTSTYSGFVGVSLIPGCMDATMWNYNASANVSDSSCIAFAYACLDIASASPVAFDSLTANTDDTTLCCYISACTDVYATNYDATACYDDGSCAFPACVGAYPFTEDFSTGTAAMSLVGNGIYAASDIDSTNAGDFAWHGQGGTSLGFNYPYNTGPLAFANSPTHIASSRICVDLTSFAAGSGIQMSFDLYQEYTYNSTYNWFRVKQDTNVLSNTNGVDYISSSIRGNSTTESYDLSAYAGQSIYLEFQNCGKYNDDYYTTGGVSYGDQSYVDNINISSVAFGCTDILSCNYDASASADDGSCFVLTASASAVDASCFGGSDASATVTNNDTTSTYTYLWSNGETTATITGLYAGTYSVVVTNSLGCTDSTGVVVGEASQMLLSVITIDATSTTNTDGSIDLSVSGGTECETTRQIGYGTGVTSGRGLFYTGWMDGVNQSTYTSAELLAAGYVVGDNITSVGWDIVTASTQSLGTVNISIIDNTQLSTSVYTGTPTAVAGWNDFAFSSSYTWNGGDIVIEFCHDASAYGSSSTWRYTSVPSSGTYRYGDFPTSSICAGGGYGPYANSFRPNIRLGTTLSPYAYAWSNASVTEDLASVAAGTYNVTVTDCNGCTATTSATINVAAIAGCLDPTMWNYNPLANINDNSCIAFAYACLDIASASPVAFDSLIANTDDTTLCCYISACTDAYASNYDATACYDDGSCIFPACVGVYPFTEDFNTGSAANIATLSGPNAWNSIDFTLNGAGDFSWHTEGYSSYVAGWVYNSTSGAANFADNSDWISGARICLDLTSYAAGSGISFEFDLTQTAYSNAYKWFRVREGANVLVNSNGVDYMGVTAANEGVTDVKTYNLSAYAGQSVVIFLESVGRFDDSYSTSSDGDNAFVDNINISSVNYGCTDSLSCNYDASATADDGSCYVLSTSTAVTNTLCNGNSDGTVTASSNDPASTYAWSNGSTGASISGLQAGTYVVTATNSYGCIATDTAIVADPAVLTLSTVASSLSAASDTNGTIDLIVTGGVACATGAQLGSGTINTSSGYVWYTYYNGQKSEITYTAAELAGHGFVSGDVITELAWKITSTPGAVMNGATMKVNGTVVYTGNYTPVVGMNNFVFTTPVTYNGGDLVVDWCSDNTSWVSGSNIFESTMIAGNISNYSDGYVGNVCTSLPLTTARSYRPNAYIKTAASPYTILWSNGATTEDLSDLGVGTYSVTVTDCNGCIATASADIVVALIPGCMDMSASNYNPLANVSDSAACTYPGCMDVLATNYDATANISDSSCVYSCAYYGNTEVTVTMYNQFSSYTWNQSGGSAYLVVTNGTDSDTLYKAVTGASLTHTLCLTDDCWDITFYDGNSGYLSEYSWDVTDASGTQLASGGSYNYLTTTDAHEFSTGSASCITIVNGCTDVTACNYDSTATVDDGSCLTVYGCTDVTACNYDSTATCDDGSCNTVYGCTDATATNYNSLATCDDGSCIATVYGCTNPAAFNYYAGANIDDGSCCLVAGCTDSTASNYNALACIDDGSCTYIISGCTDPLATNYDATATIDDGSCTYPANCNAYPTGLNVFDVIDTRVNFAWDNMNTANCMVLKYYVRYREVGTTAWITRAAGVGNGLCNFGLNTTSQMLVGLTASTTYEWKLKAFYCGGSSSNYSPVSTFTTADACPILANLAVQTYASNHTKANFTWDSTGAYTYARVALRVDTVGSAWQTVGGFGTFAPTMSQIKFGLVAGESYRAGVRAYCNATISSHRSIWSPFVFWTQPTTIRVDGGTSIANLDVYPNPSRDIFNVTFTSEDVQDLDVRVINVVGEVVYTENLEQFVGEYTKVLDLATYTKGVYFLEITTNNGVVNKKLILQ